MGLGLFMNTSGILNSCVWLLLFEALRESSDILSLCLVSGGNFCTTLSVDSVIVNYLFWKCLFVSESSSSDKSCITQRTPLSTLNYMNPKDRTNNTMGYFFKKQSVKMASKHALFAMSAPKLNKLTFLWRFACKILYNFSE